MLKIWRLIIFLCIFCQITVNGNKYLLESKKLPSDLNFMPTLGNGHLGYTVFGDAIFMNGVYNGEGGNSKRARIPNWLNVSVANVFDNKSTVFTAATKYQLQLKDGFFHTEQQFFSKDDKRIQFELHQYTCAHRYYNRALIYELHVKRQMFNGSLTIKLQQKYGNISRAFDFIPFDPLDVDFVNETLKNFNLSQIQMFKGVTRVLENEVFQKNPKIIYIVFSEELFISDGKILTLNASQDHLNYRFVLTADENATVALQEMRDVLALEKVFPADNKSEWRNFWHNFNIDIQGNQNLSQTVNAAIFYLANSLPSPATNHIKNPYFGLSPTGLGRGQTYDDYEGHNFWDTEIWMFPVATQFSTNWAADLLQYRLKHLPGARYNANITGYQGARFPWESAYTGTETTQPCCPSVAKYQVHISADIAFAVQQYYTVTNDGAWLCRIGWPLVKEIAEFLTNRTEFNSKTNKFHVKGIMGPDEDNYPVDDNGYTNVVFKMSLEFASYTQKTCATNATDTAAAATATDAAAAQHWRFIADNMYILHDKKLNYHPQFDGYTKGEEVKQADVILMGYPLQFAMNASTRLNDLLFYESVTRPSGPAMTWSMFAINFLDINEIQKADYYFEKCYKDYVRHDFKVWSETQVGYKGAVNFITGVGGFLQAIINGYGGIRFHRQENRSIMEIRKRYLLPGTSQLTITGIKFAESEFQLSIQQNKLTTLRCLKLGTKLIVFAQANAELLLHKGLEIQLKNTTAILYTK